MVLIGQGAADNETPICDMDRLMKLHIHRNDEV